MGSGAVIYVPSLIKTGSAIQKLVWWDTHAQTATWFHNPTQFFKKRKLDQKDKIAPVNQCFVSKFRLV
jgi:hypothetical protein